MKTTTTLEQLNCKFWFVLACAETKYDTRYEFWAIPKEEIETFEQAQKEASEIADDLFVETLYEDVDDAGNCWYEFTDEPFEIGCDYELTRRVHFYITTSEQDKMAVTEFCESLLK